MGGKSKALTETLNESLAKASIKVSKACAATAVNKTSVSAQNVAGDVRVGGTVKQVAKATLSCEQQTEIDAAMKSEMSAAVSASSKSKAGGLFSIYNQSDSNVKNTNRSVMESNIGVANECLAEAQNTYLVEFENVGGDFDFSAEVDQNAEAEVLACLQASTTVQDMVNGVSSSVENSSSAESNPLFGGLGNMLMTIAIIIVVVMLLAGLVKMLRSGKSKNNDGEYDGNLQWDASSVATTHDMNAQYSGPVTVSASAQARMLETLTA